MAETAIEWATHVWNPVTGCSRVSPGCAHCYALTYAGRLKAMGQPKYQRDGGRGSGPGFAVTLHEHELAAPATWRAPRRVFVNSMSDLFHEQIPDEYILAVWAVMEAAPQHTFQILTKRPERMRSLLGAERPAPPPQPAYERRAIPGWPGYAADTEGQIWSDQRGALRRLTPDIGQAGHLRVALYDGSGEPRRGRRHTVHRLMLQTFDRPAIGDEEACHRDGNPGNNAISNLYWGTQIDNWADRKRHGNGRSHSKLTARQVAELRIAAIGGENAASLGRRFGISDTQARNIIRGDQWGFSVLPNCWLGVSIGLRHFVGRADLLRETPAAVRFISAEPLLGPLVFDGESIDYDEWGRERFREPAWGDGADVCNLPPLDPTGIDWTIIGGESGPDHRPMRLEWARALVAACREAGSAVFVKQLGGARPGTKLEDLPEDLRIRDFPAVHVAA